MLHGSWDLNYCRCMGFLHHGFHFADHVMMSMHIFLFSPTLKGVAMVPCTIRLLLEKLMHPWSLYFFFEEEGTTLIVLAWAYEKLLMMGYIPNLGFLSVFCKSRLFFSDVPKFNPHTYTICQLLKMSSSGRKEKKSRRRAVLGLLHTKGKGQIVKWNYHPWWCMEGGELSSRTCMQLRSKIPIVCT